MKPENAVPKLAYDGGHLEVLWDHHDEAVRWYCEMLGWRKVDQTSSGENEWFVCRRQTHLGFGTRLRSYIPKTKRPHLFADRGSVDGNIRWCWRVRNLEEVHETFNTKGIRTSDLYKGPGDHEYFDFWSSIEGTRLTAQGDTQIPMDTTGFIPSWVRIGVNHLTAAVEWYSTYAGMKIGEAHMDKGYVIMHLGLEHHPNDVSQWVLEQLPEPVERVRVNSPVRPYFVLHGTDEFITYHSFLRNSGIEVSEIEGKHSFFHFYDPDGNRFNISRY
jgi:catechol 2,3-dioxygenase-like lactoylglutathione lyase family enzyme